jgi:hypothetical protein
VVGGVVVTAAVVDEDAADPPGELLASGVLVVATSDGAVTANGFDVGESLTVKNPKGSIVSRVAPTSNGLKVRERTWFDDTASGSSAALAAPADHPATLRAIAKAINLRIVMNELPLTKTPCPLPL